MGRVELRWFRDLDNGQAASDAMGAMELKDGPWPIAVLLFNATDREKIAQTWETLFQWFGVNATECHD